jgi:ABC-type branched-subunit amino acid transport system ATPase component/ABC-type branched-subunit amino acid transport system permease subunit
LTAVPLTAACAVALVVLPFDFRQAMINSLIGTVMALSLVVITGFVGQISVIQLSLAGVSGFAISHLAVNAGIGFPLAPLLGAAAAVVLGLVVAVSALRVRGVSLVVVTLGAAVAIANFGFINSTWGGGQTGSPVPEPHLVGVDLGPRAGFRGLDGNLPSPVFGWGVLAVTVALCLLVGVIRRGQLGQRMLAVRSNERAAAAVSIDPRNVKLIAFGISAFIAGVAGGLYAYNFGSVSGDRFDAVTALSLIAFAYAGGITLISGALFAGLISTQALLPYAFDKWLGINGNWFLLFGGAVLILTLIQNPGGVAGAFYNRTHTRAPVGPPEPAAAADRSEPGITEVSTRASPIPRKPRPRPAGSWPVLRVSGLSVAFGGVHAVNDVDLDVHEGELVGLIGPNGAGKTTLVDAITGFARCSGKVELDGRDIGRFGPHQRARLGLARTWQSTDLFDDLDVRENVTVASGAGGSAFSGRPAGHKADVEGTLALLGLEWAADGMPEELSQGQRKLVGVARALASRPRLLCLDEPAAGLDTRESDELGMRLSALADQGQSTLLIDHDMGLVLGICDRVIVLEFGHVIADGAPEVVRAEPRVISAYLGGGGQLAAAALSAERGSDGEPRG